MHRLSSSAEINAYKPGETLEAVVQVKNTVKAENPARTYINFLTSDDYYGAVSCNGHYNFELLKDDYLRLESIEVSHYTSKQSKLNYNFMLTKHSEATVVWRNGATLNTRIYPEEEKVLNMRHLNEDIGECKSKYSMSNCSTHLKSAKKSAIYGTLLEDFGTMETKSGSNTQCYYKSIVGTDEIGEIIIWVDMKVKLPKILRKGHRISVYGTDMPNCETPTKVISNKNQIYFEDCEDPEKVQDLINRIQKQKSNILSEADRNKVINNITRTLQGINPNKNINSFGPKSDKSQIYPTTPISSDKKTNSDAHSSTILKVQNLHPDVTEGDLYSKFTEIGPINFIRIHPDPSNSKFPLYAEINFKDPNNARIAFRQKNGTRIYNTPIVLSMSTQQPSRDSFGTPPIPPRRSLNQTSIQ